MGQEKEVKMKVVVARGAWMGNARARLSSFTWIIDACIHEAKIAVNFVHYWCVDFF
jgi:hypothetical protein